MGYDDDYAASIAHASDSLRQCNFAIRVQIRVGLIQNNEKGIFVESAREGNSLPLASRQGFSPFPNSSFVTIRQCQNEVVNHSSLRGENDVFCRRFGFEACYVFGYRPVAKRNVLWEVA
jgi:hypothetical protein